MISKSKNTRLKEKSQQNHYIELNGTSAVLICSTFKKQELNTSLTQIKKARTSLENSNISSLVNLWFSDLSKRYALFSSLIQDEALCEHLRNSLEFVKSEENIVV